MSIYWNRTVLLFTGEIYGLVIARAMTGVFQAPLTPCLAAFNIAWFPIEQRGRFSAVITTGIGVNTKLFIFRKEFLKLKLNPSVGWILCIVFYRHGNCLCWTMGCSVLCSWNHYNYVMHINGKMWILLSDWT